MSVSIALAGLAGACHPVAIILAGSPISFNEESEVGKKGHKDIACKLKVTIC